MKKITQKISFLLVFIMLISMISSVSTVFAANKTMNITLRIEGIEKNLFYATEKIPYTNNLTLQNVLTYIDQQENNIKITGVDAAYITDINGEAAASFGGWDGWLYKVNGKDSSDSIDNLQLSDGDSVVLYYGDPYGLGMQFPVADTSDIKDGKITFTSSDTKFDADGNPVVSVNPVINATITWSNGDKNSKYITDKNGQIKIDANELTDGSHAVQISKVGDTKLPLVLRFAPDYKIDLDAASLTANDGATTDIQNDAKNTSNDKAATNQVAKTGEGTTTAIILFVLAMAALTGFIFLGRKERYEK